MTHYVAYLRDSGGDRQDLSIERQSSMVRQWAAENGHSIGRIFVDEARSGSTTVGRSAFLDLVRYLDGHTPEQGLILWEISRLSRDYNDAQFYLASIRKNGYEVTSIADQIPSGPIGKLIESITIWSAEDERSRMRERVKSGLQYLVHVKKCWPNGRAAPVGYQYQEVTIGMRRDGTPHIGRQLVIEPAAAARVRKAYEMRAAGYSHAEIHAETRLAKRSTSYQSILSNRLYLGQMTYGGTTSEDFCEPIIDKALFDAVQRVKAAWSERLGAASPRRGTSSFLLSGLVFCDLCGRPMIGRRDTKHNKANYICIGKSNPVYDQPLCESHAIQSKRLDKIVIARVLDLLDNPQILIDLQAELMNSQNKRDEDRQSKLHHDRADLAENLRVQGNITSAIKAAGHSKALIAELQRLEAAELELRERLAEWERQAPEPIVIPDLNKLSAALRQAVQASDNRKVQLLMREIVVEIKAQKAGTYRGPITGHLRYSLGCEGLCSL